MDPIDLILASASPRRVELLTQIGVRFKQQVADIDESRQAGESAEDFVCRLAFEKAQKVYLLNGKQHPVIGSDTIVVVDDVILGKPADKDDAMNMLRQLSGRSHRVMTAVALITNQSNEVKLNCTEVTMMPLDDAIIEAYWRTGEPEGKAGAYAIQGIAGQFVSDMHGSYSAVMGLPLYETRQLLQQAGIGVLGAAAKE